MVLSFFMVFVGFFLELIPKVASFKCCMSTSFTYIVAMLRSHIVGIFQIVLFVIIKKNIEHLQKFLFQV